MLTVAELNALSPLQQAVAMLRPLFVSDLAWAYMLLPPAACRAMADLAEDRLNWDTTAEPDMALIAELHGMCQTLREFADTAEAAAPRT